MSFTITAVFAGQTVTRTPGAAAGLTDVQIGNALRLMTADKIEPPPAGLTQTQLAKFYLDAWIDEIVRYSKQEAYKNRKRELQAASTIDATAAADTAL
jgi:hypothetical protein